ncbi:hypothetical protein QBZ16_001311 [Prototheca wickerhamii]|uniref:Uncharacterized protein n=1 Tax=Prototheca wickerhamii TaxID=3111 RepID=A0AAD9MJ37_PROWI|nr:hypothetical protein QBZ16_001311 [Prototheca wickerhamii]
MAAVAAQRSVQMGTDPATLSPAQQYIAALGSYQYPPDQGRAGGPPDGPQRRLDWQAAFCALYDSFRAGVCPAFYVVPPEGRQPAERSGVVLFGSAGLGGRGAEHAILTRSSSGQRSFFANQCGLEPLTPLATRGEAAAKRGDKVFVCCGLDMDVG